ncbi:hypothetical protein BT96DRAFT_923055 [Gymnopus androsaceus JB14]|uniref:Uncharacterized protein n=1 Tax=Gymnopus androsaceus JB14 TaxID=1447944 RepID=A0A6A4HA67_9AGAR|nr:hypothetical protein BT96DRAFT_923055 [Gymnopus androsaceus JB14]
MPGNICSKCRDFVSENSLEMISNASKKRKKKGKDSAFVFGSSIHRILLTNNSQGLPLAPQLGTCDFEFAKAQITAILSISTPYQTPTDPSLVLDTLIEIAKYTRSLENELRNRGIYPLDKSLSSPSKQVSAQPTSMSTSAVGLPNTNLHPNTVYFPGTSSSGFVDFDGRFAGIVPGTSTPSRPVVALYDAPSRYKWDGC